MESESALYQRSHSYTLYSSRSTAGGSDMLSGGTERVSPPRRPGRPEHPQLGTKSQTLGRFTKDFGLSSKGNGLTEDFRGVR